MASKKFDLQEYKKTIKTAATPLKKDKFIELDEALKSVIGMKGIPLGHVTQVYGLSDSGKTTLAFHTAAQAQKQGIVPVFIVTESKVSWERAEAMGLNKSNAIILYAEYLEEIFTLIRNMLNEQAKGELPVDLMFFVDSIGNSISVDSIKTNKDGTTELGGAMMKAAKTIRENMRVLSHKINDTRKISSPNYAGLFFINHAYTKPPSFPGGMSSIVPYGGDGIWYSASLVIKTKRGKKLTATKDGAKISFAVVSKLTVDKNHITDVSNEGEFIIAADAIIPNDKGAIQHYKDTHKDQWGDTEIVNEDGELVSE